MYMYITIKLFSSKKEKDLLVTTIMVFTKSYPHLPKSVHHTVRVMYKNPPMHIHNRVLDNHCILNDGLKRQQVSGASNIVTYNTKNFELDVVDVREFEYNSAKNEYPIDTISVVNWKHNKDDGYILYGYDCLLVKDERVKEIRRYFDEDMTTYSNDELDHTM